MHATSLRRLASAVTCSALLAWASPASANLVWTWSFNNGAEAGTFTTEGSLADLAGPADLAVLPALITVTASSLAPSLIGTPGFTDFPAAHSGLQWDGSAITHIYHDNVINSANFVAGNFRLSLGVVQGQQLAVLQTLDGSASTGVQTAVFALAPAAVPEPASALLMTLGALGLGAMAQRRRAQHA